MQDKTICLLLAGGEGSRLSPLTKNRAKPAVPFGGRYRIIDFTLSNCLHSGLRRILVLTQYKSHSLQKHLRDGWAIFNPELKEYITPVPPQMRTGKSWYTGTADAIYQNLYLLERSGAELALILSGDHIYRMDYAAMLQFHVDKGSDVTIASMEVTREEAKSFGVLEVDSDDRVVDFREKVPEPPTLPNRPDYSLASMGIYVFSLGLLMKSLRADHRNTESKHDFGRNIFPSLVQSHRVFAYQFGGSTGRVTQDRYWRDVGTIDAFYEANMDLLKPVPSIDLYQTDWRIRTYEGQHPPARTVEGKTGTKPSITNCILASGTIISGGTVINSILFPSTYVDEGAVVESSILFDDVIVGPDTRLKKCIVDKNVHIPEGETIGLDRARDAARFMISPQGVVIVPEGYQFET